VSLPYEWFPLAAERIYRPPEVGNVLAIDHQAYEVIEVHEVDRADWTDHDVRYVDKLRYPPPYAVDTRALTGPRKGATFSFRMPSGVPLRAYPDRHIPVCLDCGDVLPCREQMAATVSAASAKRVSRYETAGVCPACSEPVTQRQKSLTWEDNAVIPGGPPVTFHTRLSCAFSAREYEKKWVAADPERRRTLLSCTGHVTNHNDGTYECTEHDACPGPSAYHPSWTVCRCVGCHANGPFGCTPSPKARLIDRRTP